MLFGPEARSGPALIGTGMLHFGGLELSRQAAGTIVVAAIIIAAQYLLFAKTQLGRRLRATAEDREMAEAIGIPAKILIAITFGLGTALAGIAGALLANQYFVYPTGGIALSVLAYIAVVIGGWGSLAGAVLGSLCVLIAFNLRLRDVAKPVTATARWVGSSAAESMRRQPGDAAPLTGRTRGAAGNDSPADAGVRAGLLVMQVVEARALKRAPFTRYSRDHRRRSPA